MAKIDFTNGVKRAIRVYSFINEYTTANGETFLYRTSFECVLSHRIGSDSVQVAIREAGTGHIKLCGLSDVGITWKSLLYAYNVCASLAQRLQADWYEMDVQNDGGSDIDVIPEQKLSTATKETAP